MTIPPPPPGNYPPPPPPGAATFRPHRAVGTSHLSPASTAPAPSSTAPWVTRVLAWLIDWAPIAILSGLGSIFLVTMQKVDTVCITDDSQYQLGDFCATGNNGPTGVAWTIYAVLEVISLAYLIWNLGLKQGKTGSSLGKGIMKFKVVGEDTGQPIGFGKSFGRELVYIVAYAVCFVPWLVAVLWPLWDPKRQSGVDKLIKTVCVPL